MFNTLAPIDRLCPVATGQPLNRGLLSWHLALPGMVDSVQFRSLANNASYVAQRVYSYPMALTGNGGRIPATTPIASAYASFPRTAAYPSLSQFTISHWQKTATNASIPLYTSYYIPFMYTGVYKCYFPYPTTLSSGTSYTTDWTNLAITYDGTTATFFVNGISTATTAASGSINLGQLSIGGDNGFTAFDGIVDDVRVQSVALTGPEVAQLYRESVTGYPTLLRRRPSVVYFLPQATAKGRRTLYYRVGSRGVA